MFPIKYLQVNIPYISIYIFTRLFIPTQHGINNLFLSSQKKFFGLRKTLILKSYIDTENVRRLKLYIFAQKEAALTCHHAMQSCTLYLVSYFLSFLKLHINFHIRKPLTKL